MVVKMMKWRPWSPLTTKKFEVKITVDRLRGLDKFSEKGFDSERFVVEIRWEGSKSKGIGLTYLRPGVRRNFTREGTLRDDWVVEWNEEFQSFCSFSANKQGIFLPWEVTFTVYNGLKQGPKTHASLIATSSLNLSEFALADQGKQLEISTPLTVPGGSIECNLSLCLSLSFLEVRSSPESSEKVLGQLASFPQSTLSADALLTEKGDTSIKTSLRKVKTSTRFASARKAKKACHEEENSDGKSSTRSEDGAYAYPFDTDSIDHLDSEDLEEVKEEDFGFRKSFSYGPLTSYANFIRASTASNSVDEDLVYYSNSRSDMRHFHVEESTLLQSSKRSILPWKKRRLSFKSPKAKGEPLLKKNYGEEGGDDIDFDRRQLSSSDESTFVWHKEEQGLTTNRSSVSEFGDDNFSVGSWEKKEVISRDGDVKLQTQIFYASIDQRSEQAAGESACTALVAVIADWFHCNSDQMPIKSQLDSLIQEGSLEWRNLCEDVAYTMRFPDKHFDLETVLQAEVRPLSVVPEKSFVGFFYPEWLNNQEGFDLLHGAMSFDSIWDEISKNNETTLYIVSWNDHFFILKVEMDAYYIVDTLGERLYEGCNQAYILKFDEETTMSHVCKEAQSSEKKPASEETKMVALNESQDSEEEEEESVLCRGKECCKEYIKKFLAAIPTRELQVDLKKGLMASIPLHHRLQIEFHYTQRMQA